MHFGHSTRNQALLPRRSSFERPNPMQTEKPPIDRIFHALADPTRRAILEQLSTAPSSASRLVQQLAITLAAVVQHLQVLEECGLVRTEKAGRVRTCQIDPAGLATASQWIADRRSRWEKRLERLGELLAEPPDCQ